MKKSNLKETIDFVGLSYKKELTIVLVINIAFFVGAVLIYIFLKNFIYSVFILVAIAVLDYFMFSRYSDKKKAILKNRENELVSIISYFDVYIRNNKNVYQSFNQLIPYCSNWMKEKVEDLLKEIDEDKSVQPYVNFANNFQNLSMHSLMISIYQMVDQGESAEQLTHFNVIFEEISRVRQQEMINQKDKALSGMSTFPLIGAGMITIALTISILTILGDLINVI